MLLKKPINAPGIGRKSINNYAPNCNPAIRLSKAKCEPGQRLVNLRGKLSIARRSSFQGPAGTSDGNVGSGSGNNRNSGSNGRNGGPGSGPGGHDQWDSPAKHPMQIWTYLYAAALAAGGIMAYVKKNSSKSLGGGLSVGLILALSARSMQGATMASGAQVAFVLSLLMGIFFVARFASSRKVMPGGVGAGLSLAMAIGLVSGGL